MYYSKFNLNCQKFQSLEREHILWTFMEISKVLEKRSKRVQRVRIGAPYFMGLLGVDLTVVE